ncbi:helix-turn-helix transcriptional regulator, partial [Streptomyces eurythermus]
MAAEAVAAGTRGAPSRPRRAAGPPPVAFSGLVESGRPHPRVSEPSTPATAAPRSPTVTSGPGPGGRAGSPARSYALPHRARSRRAGHAYGTPLAAEDIRGMLTAPVVLRRRARGVLHGAPRSTRPPDAGVTAARDA